MATSDNHIILSKYEESSEEMHGDRHEKITSAQHEAVEPRTIPNSIITPAQDDEQEKKIAVSTLTASFEDIESEVELEGPGKRLGSKYFDVSAESSSACSGTQDLRLNPMSEEFDYERWLQRRFRDPTHCRKSDTSVAYRNLNVYGFGTQTDYQKTFANYPLRIAENIVTKQRKSRVDILRNLEGVVKSGEMLVVLGRPRSGCSTLLKAIAGRMHGLKMDDKSVINYQGIISQIIHSEFRGECSYQAESDVHFPHLTVGQTLQLGAAARAPENAVRQSTSRRALKGRLLQQQPLLSLRIP